MIDVSNPATLLKIAGGVSIASSACGLLVKWLPEPGTGPDQIAAKGYAVFIGFLHRVALNPPVKP